MPKLNTTVKSVRVDNEKIDELEKRLNGQTFNSWLNEVIDDYLNGSSGTFSSKNGRDLLEMLSCFKKSESEFIDDIHELMENGTLTYENGRLTIDLGFDYQAFLDFCQKRKANPATVWKNLGKEIGF